MNSKYKCYAYSVATNELDGSNIPAVSVDRHFANVPGIEESDLHRIHIYLRPDYKLDYTAEERKMAKEVTPDDHTDAASCEVLEKHSPYGRKGDISITLVYGSGYGSNTLLIHETIHA